MNLKLMGLNEHFENQFRSYDNGEIILGRVALEHKRLYRVWTELGELLCEVSGKFSYTAASREDFPSVGDWVVLKARPEELRGTIHSVLPRTSTFSRKVAGSATEEQIVAANVDTIFLVNSLNEDLNLRRIERYLLLTWESGANPVIVLTKSDLCEDLDNRLLEVASVSLGVPVIPISVINQSGTDQLTPFLQPGKTVALLGSSGVGKSTLTNFLLGEQKQKIQEIRQTDDKGKHTTTHRELVSLPNGALLIDTPGMRELQLWEGDDGLSGGFSDIELLANQCRFRDCTHGNEPGCAIMDAIQEGHLDHERYSSYKKLQKELAYLDRKLDKKSQADEKKRMKQLTNQSKQKTK